MQFLRINLVAIALLGGLPHGASATPARFWISSSKVDPNGPASAVIPAAEGRERFLYIWAQPATGKILESFSLNLVVPHEIDSVVPVVDILDTRIKVYNPLVGAQPRFQFVYDSYPQPGFQTTLTSNETEAQVLAGKRDGIGGTIIVPGEPNPQPEAGRDIQGFSVNSSGYMGIGHIHDPLLATSATGPAWLVAEVGFKTVRSTGTNPYYLQIGYNGMHHRNETAAQMDVVFGDGSGLVYNAGNLGHRQTTLPDDQFDVRIDAAPFVQGDFDGNGGIGPEDFQYWKSSFGQQVVPGFGADGNGDGVIDAADYVVWRKQMATGSGMVNAAGNEYPNTRHIAIPEPTAVTLAWSLVILILLLLQTRWEKRDVAAPQ